MDQVQHFVRKETRVVDYAHLNTFLEVLKMTYDEPDRVRTVARDIPVLKGKNQSFSSHLTLFRRILGTYAEKTRLSKINCTRVSQKS